MQSHIQWLYSNKLIWDENNLDEYQAATSKVLSEYESLFKTPEFIPFKWQLYWDQLVKTAEIFLETKEASLGEKSRGNNELN
jgi:hypothetical protein